VGALLDWCAHECATMGEVQPAALAAAAAAKEVRPPRYCPARHVIACQVTQDPGLETYCMMWRAMTARP
jgi:hypothetical protein